MDNMRDNDEVEEMLKIIQSNHDDSFVDNYNDWNNIVKTMNSDIEKYINSIGLESSIFRDKLYSYDEFCKLYVENIKIVYKQKNQLDQSDINDVIKALTSNKINEINTDNLDEYNVMFLNEFKTNNAIGRYV